MSVVTWFYWYTFTLTWLSNQPHQLDHYMMTCPSYEKYVHSLKFPPLSAIFRIVSFSRINVHDAICYVVTICVVVTAVVYIADFCTSFAEGANKSTPSAYNM